MSTEQTLRAELDSVRSNADFTRAVMAFRDGSRLWFCHRVDERWVRALSPAPAEGRPAAPPVAARILPGITTFRLNAKHLDIRFGDGSRWDEPVPAADASDFPE